MKLLLIILTSVVLVTLCSDMNEPYSFVNSRGVILYGTRWAPDNEPLGLVYISHGYAEHMEYYDELGTALAEAGLLAFGHDHEGHGMSGGERVNILDFQYYVDDIYEDIQMTQKEQMSPWLPIFVFGHSMGALVAALASIERRNMFQGMVLTGALVMTENTHGTNSSKNRAMAKAATEFSQSMEIVGTRLYTTEITGDTDVVKQIQKDPLYWKGQVKAGHMYAGILAMDRLEEEVSKLAVPLLVLHGSEDKITQVQGSRLLVSGASSEDKQFIEMVGKKHHLILEVEGDRTIMNIVTWITDRLYY